VCDLETSRMGAPYIYDISSLRVNLFELPLPVPFFGVPRATPVHMPWWQGTSRLLLGFHQMRWISWQAQQLLDCGRTLLRDMVWLPNGSVSFSWSWRPDEVWDLSDVIFSLSMRKADSAWNERTPSSADVIKNAWNFGLPSLFSWHDV
jgi:hypothetical protein